MLYSKPKNVTIIDMCIYIDNNAYVENHDSQKIFEYLYFISRYFAMKYRWFKKIEYYDDFAIFSASRLYMRLVNKKQFDDQNKMKPIKSILNYVKSTLYGTKVDFEQSYFYKTMFYEDEYYNKYNFENLLSYSNDFTNKVIFDMMLDSTSSLIYQCINSISYKINSAIKFNLITSIKLTLLNQITLTSKSKEYLLNLKSTNRIKDRNIDEAFDEIRDNVCLFHLDDSFKDIVLVIVRKIKKKFAFELIDLIPGNIINDNYFKDVSRNYKKEVELQDEYEF